MDSPLRIGIIGYEGIQALDLVGPSDAFTSAFIERDAAMTAGQGAGGKSPGLHPDRADLGHRMPRRAYEVVVLGVTAKPFTAESGIVFKPTCTLEDAPPLDTLIIPGGCGMRTPEVSVRVAAWVKANAGKIRRIASVCTGIYGLAPSGLLDGRTVTTHWRFAQEVAQQFPRLDVQADSLYIKSEKFYTAAGITAGIDLALALIEEDLGPRVALAVARELVVYLKRPGGQEQFSEPLRFQTEAADNFSDLAAWAAGHLRQDLSVEALAERANLCPRQFTRRFRTRFGTTPATFVEDLRLDEARRRLSARTDNIERIAESVGFRSADAFRRAFERRFGVSPRTYRDRFLVREGASSIRAGVRAGKPRSRSVGIKSAIGRTRHKSKA